MLALLDTVRLKKDHPELGLSAGVIGAVVHVHGPDRVEVEFVSPGARDSVLATLSTRQLQPEPAFTAAQAARRA